MAKGLKVLKDIVEGYKNLHFPDKGEEELIEITREFRMEECRKCSYHSRHLPKSKQRSTGPHCTKCGCNLRPKTSCLSCRCPLSDPKWEEVNPDDIFN